MSTVSAPRLPEQFGRYRIVKMVGEGGMGAVYLARDTQLDRDVALKVPQFADGDSAQLLERFYQEARAAATVQHPNICPIFDVGAIDGVHYLSMAFIDGIPLEKWAVGEKAITQRQIAVLIRKIAVAMNEAHKKGVVHRDLKPANIMVNRRGEPIVMDFGLARRTQPGDQRLTQSGAIMGSPAYMAPEQVKGQTENIGPPSDIYSLGVILYELLTNRPPFIGDDNIAVLAQVLMDAPTPPSKYRPDLDAALEAICLKAMAKKPEDRFASMAELAEALQDYLRGSPRQPQAPGPEPAPRPSQAPTIPPSAVNTPPPGLRATMMGGLKSFAKLQAQLPRGRKAEPGASPPSRRRRRKKKSAIPTWVWFAIGGVGLIAAAALITVLVFNGSAPGTLRIKLEPAVGQFELQVDGKPYSHSGAEVKLPAGRHELLITASDYESERRSVTIQRGANLELNIALRPKVDLAQKPPVKLPGPAKPEEQVKFVPPELPKSYRNPAGIDFILVPKGKSWLGGRKGRPGSEFHQDYDFYLGKYLITQEEWEKITGQNPSSFSHTGSNQSRVKDVSDADLKRFPVDNVSWIDCQEFVTLLNQKYPDKDWVYRLPTVAEWEYACRGGPMSDSGQGSFDFYLDAPSNTLSPEHANFGDRFGRPTKVGSYLPNSRGLYDMHGNLWEFCDDEMKNAKGEPTRIAKGGGYMSPPGRCSAVGEAVREVLFGDPGRGLRIARVPASRITAHAPLSAAMQLDATKKKLDDLIESYRVRVGASAGVLAIERDGKEIYSRAFGFRDKENRTATTLDTLFALGLGGGPIAHAALGQLIEKKKVNPGDSLLKWLNVQPAGKVVDKRVWSITIQNAIDGAMGWDVDSVAQTLKAVRANSAESPPMEVVLAMLATKKLTQEPGIRDARSTFNVQVMMAIISKAAGRPAIDYFRYDLLGREVAGFRANDSDRTSLPVAWNTGAVCVSASALLEFMRQFAPGGTPGSGPGVRNWWNSNVVGHMVSRPNRVHAVVLYNGTHNEGQPAFLGELNRLLDALLTASQ